MVIEKKASGKVFFGATNREWLSQIAKLIDEGKIKVAISKIYPLGNAVEAHRAIETGQLKGKVLLEVKKKD